MKHLTTFVTAAALMAAASLSYGAQKCCGPAPDAQTAPQAQAQGPTTPSTVFAQLTGHYLLIQAQLAADSLDDVALHATAMAARSGSSAQVAPAEWGIAPEHAEHAGMLMARVTTAADKLKRDRDLKQARLDFGELSAAMVALRDMAQGARPVVAYCPMADREWLQVDAVIANPFLGTRMLHCGSVVR